MCGWCYHKVCAIFLQTKPMPYQLFVLGGQEKGYKTPGAVEVLNMWRCDITGRRWHYYFSNYIIIYIYYIISYYHFYNDYFGAFYIFAIHCSFLYYQKLLIITSYTHTFTIGFNSTLTFCDFSLTRPFACETPTLQFYPPCLSTTYMSCLYEIEFHRMVRNLCKQVFFPNLFLCQWAVIH